MVIIVILVILVAFLSIVLATSEFDDPSFTRWVFLIQCILLSGLIYCIQNRSEEIGAKKLLEGKIYYKITGIYKNDKFIPTDTIMSHE